MNWEYFRDPKTGEFKLRRLPPIKSPIRVEDITEVGDWREDFAELPFETAVRKYETGFDELDAESDDLYEALEKVPAHYLGDLAPLKKEGVILELAEHVNPDKDHHAIAIKPSVARKLSQGDDPILRPVPLTKDEAASLLKRRLVPELKELCTGLGLSIEGNKIDLVDRLATHEAANHGAVIEPSKVMPLPGFYRRLRESVEQMVDELVKQLESYPSGYRQRALRSVALSFQSDHIDIRQIIADKSGIQIQEPPTRMTKEWQAAKLAAREQPQKPYRAADSSWPTSYKVAAIVIAILIIWALL